MTPEGRLKEVPIKVLAAGEAYTEEELRTLRAYWTEERTRAVAEWLDEGAPRDANTMPDCLLDAARPLDLRGINLASSLTTPRTEESPTLHLAMAHLEHAYIGPEHLEHADLSGAYLEHADLSGAYLGHADLRGARLQHARLSGAHLEHAGLGEAHAERANLDEAHLEHARLLGTRLEHARLSGAHLEHAELKGARILETDFVGVYLDDTVFRDVVWRHEQRRDPEAKLFRGFDVRGIRYSDPLFDQWVRQAHFVHAKREVWWNPWRLLARMAPGLFGFAKNWPPPLWLVWKGTCDCGRSFRRWVIACAAVAVFFGLLFWVCADVWGVPVVTLSGAEGSGRITYPTTYLYFSIVTFTTLGFGDVTPTGVLGELLVALEVLLGYVGLAGLISIFMTKCVPPR